MAILTGLCFALRLFRLADKSLWVDEIWSLHIAQFPWHSLGRVIATLEPNASLYYALLHLWLKLGDSEFIIRSFSVLCATATIPLMYLLGKRLGGPAHGLTAALLVTFNMFHLQWSQETRGYALLVLLVALASWLFLQCVEAPTPARWLLYALVCSAAVYVHLYAALVVIAHWASLPLLNPRQAPWRGMFFSSCLFGSLSAPLLYLIYVRSKSPLFPVDWLSRLSPYLLYKSAHQMAGNPHYEGVTGGNWLLALALLLCLLALFSFAECARRCGRSPALWQAGMPLCWLVVPPLMMYAESLVQPMFVYRYLLVSLPAMALTMADGLHRIRPRWASVAVTLLVPLLGASGLVRYYRYRASFTEWRAVSHKIAAEAQPGDGAIYCIAPGRLLVDYYEHAQAPGSVSPEVLYPDFPGFDQDPRSLEYLPHWNDDRILAGISTHSRVWLVLYHDFFKTTQDARDHLKSLLKQQYPYSAVTRIDGVTVDVYSRTSIPSIMANSAQAGALARSPELAAQRNGREVKR